MPEVTWKTAKLGDLCSIKTGKLNANAAVENGEYPFFTCSRIDSKIDTYAFDGEALLVAGNGDVGFTKYYNGKFNAYQRTYVLMNFSVNAKLMYYVLKAQLPDRIRAWANGSAVPYIKLNVLSDMEIRYPEDIKEQQRIVEILADLDSLASLHKSKADILSKMKSQLMSNKTGIIEQERQKSEIPAGWVKVKLGDICKIKNGKVNAKSAIEDGAYPLFTANVSGESRINSYSYDTEAIMIARNGSAGFSKYYKGKFEVSDHCFCLSEFPSNYRVQYVYYWLKAIQDKIQSVNQGSGIPGTNIKILSGVDVLVPTDLAEQDRIIKILESYDGLIESQSQLIQIVEREREQLQRELLTV